MGRVRVRERNAPEQTAILVLAESPNTGFVLIRKAIVLGSSTFSGVGGSSGR